MPLPTVSKGSWYCHTDFNGSQSGPGLTSKTLKLEFQVSCGLALRLCKKARENKYTKILGAECSSRLLSNFLLHSGPVYLKSGFSDVLTDCASTLCFLQALLLPPSPNSTSLLLLVNRHGKAATRRLLSKQRGPSTPARR